MTNETKIGSLRWRLTAIGLVLMAAALVALDVAIYTGVRQREYNELNSKIDAASAHAFDISPTEKFTPEMLAKSISAPEVAAIVYRRGVYPVIGKPAGFETPLPAVPRSDAARGRRVDTPGTTDESWAQFQLAVDDNPNLIWEPASPWTSRTTPASGDSVLFVSSREPLEARLDRLLLIELVGTMIVLGIAAFLFGFVIRLTLRPLNRMVAVAGRISAGDMRQRLHPSKPGTELGRLATAFDAMVDSLADSLVSEREAREHAARSEKRMRDFLSDASHELRTPIAGMQWSAEALLRHGTSREERERLSFQIARQARRASQLVSDLLSIARIDREKTLELEIFDLTELAADEIERLRDLEPGISFTLSGGKECLLFADPDRVRQVLSNLLDNARKAMSGKGEIEITVRRHDGEAELTVQDSGPGVPPTDRERVFERFVRLDGSRTREEYGFGSGLGLAIARGIAEAHGGKLICAPSAAGARFVLTLPLSRRAQRSAEASSLT